MTLEVINTVRDTGSLRLTTGNSILITRNGGLLGDFTSLGYAVTDVGLASSTGGTVMIEGFAAANSAAVNLLGANHRVMVAESGAVYGSVFMSGNASVFDNLGTVDGIVSLGSASGGAGRVNNAGSISNDDTAVLMIGNLAYVSNTGTITGGLSTSSATSVAVNMGQGAFTWLVNHGTISAYNFAMIGGTGRNSVLNFGAMEGNIDMGGGTGGGEKLVNTGNIFGAISNFGSGGGIVDNDGKITGAVTMTTGTDTVRNSGSMTDVLFGSGPGGDTLINSGQISGQVAGFGAVGYVRNSGNIDGLVTMGNGSDFVYNSGIIAAVSMGGGTATDRLENAGQIDGNVIFLAPADVWNSGRILGSLTTGTGDDTVTNRGEMRDVVLGDGNDRFVTGGDGVVENAVAGGNGNDALRGGDAGDWFLGDQGADSLRGGAGDDTLAGGAGNDSLNGGEGDDDLQGGFGVDTVRGGSGADRFVFATVTELSTAGPLDTILDFAAGQDRIDLAGVFAGTLVFNGTGAFAGGGTASVIYAAAGGAVTVSIDADGNGTADGRILLAGLAAVAAADFVL